MIILKFLFYVKINYKEKSATRIDGALNSGRSFWPVSDCRLNSRFDSEEEFMDVIPSQPYDKSKDKDEDYPNDTR